MLLAEALAERAEAQRRYEQLMQRLLRVVRVQEGDQPVEDPEELLVSANGILDRMDWLIRCVNKTNTQTMFDDKHTQARRRVPDIGHANPKDELGGGVDRGVGREERAAGSEQRGQR